MKNIVSILVGVVVFFVLGIGAAFLLPWSYINWGKVDLGSPRQITVTGTAQSTQRNQIARFNVGVTATNDDKNAAVTEVNTKISSIIETVKNFGIEDKDVQTQNMSVYQEENRVLENGSYSSKPGQWRANNSIMVTLRNVDRAGELAGVLSGTGATNVNGPMLGLDSDLGAVEEDLLAKAIDDARSQAEVIAKAAGAKLGRVVNVIEGNSSSSVMPLRAMSEDAMGMGGPAPIEVGSSDVSKTVTVVFELK